MKTKAQILNITDFPYIEHDDKGNNLYYENSNGYWCERKYDDRNNIIEYENNEGHWFKKTYDYLGDIIYHEDSDGNYWNKKLIPNVPFPY